jgi:rRNA maturation endonuclease Nob1
MTSNNLLDNAELEKYYKFIKICVLCKKEYGVDKKYKKDNKLCPICAYKMRNNKKVKMQIAGRLSPS